MAAKKNVKPSVSINLDLFKAIKAKEAEYEELRNNKIELFMAEDGDGDVLVLNALLALKLSSYAAEKRGKREDNMVPNPNFNRTDFTNDMILDELPQEWKDAKITKEDVHAKLVQIWRGQGNETEKKKDGTEGPKLEVGCKGWLKAFQGVGLAGIKWAVDTDKLGDITDDGDTETV